VLVDLPKDVQTETAEIEFPEKIEIKGYRPYIKPDPEALREAAKMIIQAQKPVILVGGGAVKSEVGPLVLELAETFMIPIASTLMGKGAVPETISCQSDPLECTAHIMQTHL